MKRSNEEKRLMMIRQALRDLYKTCQATVVIDIKEYKKLLDNQAKIDVDLEEIRVSHLRGVL